MQLSGKLCIEALGSVPVLGGRKMKAIGQV